jgi:hypothetical protein
MAGLQLAKPGTGCLSDPGGPEVPVKVKSRPGSRVLEAAQGVWGMGVTSLEGVQTCFFQPICTAVKLFFGFSLRCWRPGSIRTAQCSLAAGNERIEQR